MELLSRVNLAVTAGLTTLIWLIQILHYPFFTYLHADGFREAMVFHQQRISYIVIPLMLTELILAALFAVKTPGWPTYLCLGIVVSIWITTVLFQVPLHNKLLEGLHVPHIASLVSGNWIRTILWTLKALILLLAV